MNRPNTSTNTPSRSLNSPGTPQRARKPQRPLPGLPVVLDTSVPPGPSPPPHPSPSSLMEDDFHQPFQLLDAPPLSLLCTFHNVKRVSLEAGVPPPLRLDVPIMPSALSSADPLLPTHILAVYDQDAVPEQTGVASESPFSAYVPVDPPSLPSTPIMIPINAELWTKHLSMSIFSSSPGSQPDSPRTPSSVAQRRTSLLSTYSASPRSSRILSLPIIILRVPNASVLPLLLLAALEVLPINCVAPALLPRQVLNELPAAPALLAENLLQWLRPPEVPQTRRSEVESAGRRVPLGFKKRDVPDSRRASSSSEASRSDLDIGDQVSKGPSRLSVSSSSDVPSSPVSYQSSMRSVSSSSSASAIPRPFQQSPIPEGSPICVLTDPSTASDPDMRLILLAQQNFGMWANSLALGTRESRVTHLVELAWSVAAEARRLRFGDVVTRQTATPSRSRPPASRRHRSRTPVPDDRQFS